MIYNCDPAREAIVKIVGRVGALSETWPITFKKKQLKKAGSLYCLVLKTACGYAESIGRWRNRKIEKEASV